MKRFILVVSLLVQPLLIQQPIVNHPSDYRYVEVQQFESKTKLEKLSETRLTVSKPSLPKGDKYTWLKASGIPEADWKYVDYIIQHESGWRVTIKNPSSSAYGLCQANPGSKMSTAGADWQTNPVTQLKWCDGYARERYSGWAEAYSFWLRNSWW